MQRHPECSGQVSRALVSDQKNKARKRREFALSFSHVNFSTLEKRLIEIKKIGVS